VSRDEPTRIRRPRYVPFLGTGLVVGLLATVILALTSADSAGSPRRLMLYLGILLGGLGALAGGAVAVWLERGAHDDKQLSSHDDLERSAQDD
jgi:hypothetical protein